MRRNFFDGLVIGLKSIFWGMKGADEMMTKLAEPNEIRETKGGGGAFQDMLEGVETNEVQETRDAYYRVLKESDNYKVEITGGFNKEEDNNQGEISYKVSKKENRFIGYNVPLLETRGYSVEVIQDHKCYENGEELRAKEAMLGSEINDPQTEIFQIERDFTARYPIEFMIKKAVVKKNKNGRRILDIYLPAYARQFNKKDSLFISEIKKIYEGTNYKSEMFDFKTFGFITDKCFGVENLREFKFKINKLRGVKIFDGSYVASFDVTTLIDEDVTEKYKTKGLSEKYQTNALKGESTGIEAIIRKEKIK